MFQSLASFFISYVPYIFLKRWEIRNEVALSFNSYNQYSTLLELLVLILLLFWWWIVLVGKLLGAREGNQVQLAPAKKQL